MNISNLSDLISQSQNTGNAEKAAQVSTRPTPEVKAEKPKAELSMSEMTEVLQRANKAMIKSGSDLKFSMDLENGKPVIQIIDRETDKVLRQIPSVEMLALSKALEKMQGVLMSRSA
ncbi:MAG: flagellar protein FlaG [Limnobacter sp.]|nr:flagellar protein FlaG [Limnobacter sp.]